MKADPGGLQEEATFFWVPVIVLKVTTGRPEGVTAGTLKLAGTKEENILNIANELLTDKVKDASMSDVKNPYGDGESSKRIVDIIKTRLKS